MRRLYTSLASRTQHESAPKPSHQMPRTTISLNSNPAQSRNEGEADAEGVEVGRHRDRSKSRWRFDAAMLRDATWWSWVVIVGLLVARFVSDADAAYAAIAICGGFAAIDLFLRRGDWRAMSVQIRASYTLMLVIGMLPGMAWLHAVQLVGTTVRVVTGYCLLERELRLVPMNRIDPLTLRAAWDTLTTRPGAGGLLRFGDDGARRSVCALPR